MLALMTVLATQLQAQTLTVLHQFTGGADGSNPYSSLVMDRSGNLYGVVPFGGSQLCETQNGIGCGTVFKLAHRTGGWVFSSLYAFTGYADGANPVGSLTIAPDGSIYGTTDAGGHENCRDTWGDGCGTVFHLQPQPTFCASFSCSWNKTVLYQFTGGSNGNDPLAGVVLDGAGNLYGTLYQGGASQLGAAYEVSRSGSSWVESTIHSFGGRADGADPMSGLIFDGSGNLYGTTEFGGGAGGCTDGGCGTVFQLTPSASGWSANVIYNFPGGYNIPSGGLVFDPQGNLYGTFYDGITGAFELSPSNGTWTFSLLYSNESGGTALFSSTLARDTVGNFYGTSEIGGNSPPNCEYGCGFVYKLTPSGSGWSFTQLYAFTGGADGAFPDGGVALDASGNIYGTTFAGGTNQCGSQGCGVVWEISNQ
jgi:hypothetical protein